MSKEIIRNIFLIGFIVYILLKVYKYKKKLKSESDYKKRIVLYYVSNKYNKAIDLAEKALNKFELNREDEITFLLAIANSYYELNEYKLSVDYYEKAFNKAFSYKKNYYFSECFIYALDALLKLDRKNDAKDLFLQITQNRDKKEFKKLIRFAEKNNLI